MFVTASPVTCVLVATPDSSDGEQVPMILGKQHQQMKSLLHPSDATRAQYARIHGYHSAKRTSMMIAIAVCLLLAVASVTDKSRLGTAAVFQTAIAHMKVKHGMGLVLSPTDLAPHASVASRDGMVVEVAKGRSGLAGIRRGDKLLTVNGIAVKTFREARREIQRSGGTTTLVVKRGEQSLAFRIAAS